MRNIREKVKPTLNKVLSFLLFIAIAFSIITIIQAAAPDPGHLYTESSGGVVLGDIIYGSGTDTLDKLSGAAGFLKSTGAAAPAWSVISLTADVGTSILPVANGGTDVATLGDAGVLIGNGTGAVQVTGAGSSGQVLTSNGAGVDPTFQTPADPRITTKALSANQADITGITLVEVTALTVASLPAGTYVFQYFMIYQTTATTTGVEFVVDHTGTDSAFVSNARFGSTGGAAATGIADQIGVGTAAGLMEVKTQRSSGLRPGVTIGVDTINANTLMIIEGAIVTTSVGDLKLMMAAELAALVVRAKAGSALILTKVL